MNQDTFLLESGPGAHIDTTMLLAAIEALRLIDETKDRPITFDLLITLSQFIEAIVLQDNLYYPESLAQYWTPYMEVIEHSGIEQHLSRGILVRQEDAADSDELKLQALRWAVQKIESVNLDALRWAVDARPGIRLLF